MRGPFFRSCPQHRGEVVARYSKSGHESLWCSVEKHRMFSWDVVDSDGEVMAIAFMHEAPQIVSPDMTLPNSIAPAPETLCKRGHYDWVAESDGWRCRICRRDRAVANDRKTNRSHKKKQIAKDVRSFMKSFKGKGKKCRKRRKRQMELSFQ